MSNVPDSEDNGVPLPLTGAKKFMHGNIFQLRLLMLFMLRGIKAGYDFEMYTERPDLAGAFDDIIFGYKPGDDVEEINKDKWRLIQAKHKQDNSETIKASELTGTNKNDSFNLTKYFISYLKAIERLKLDQTNNEGDNIEDCIIVTNISFKEDDLNHNGITLKKVENFREDDKILYVDDPHQRGPQKSIRQVRLKFVENVEEKNEKKRGVL